MCRLPAEMWGGDIFSLHSKQFRTAHVHTRRRHCRRIPPASASWRKSLIFRAWSWSAYMTSFHLLRTYKPTIFKYHRPIFRNKAYNAFLFFSFQCFWYKWIVHEEFFLQLSLRPWPLGYESSALPLDRGVLQESFSSSYTSSGDGRLKSFWLKVNPLLCHILVLGIIFDIVKF